MNFTPHTVPNLRRAAEVLATAYYALQDLTVDLAAYGAPDAVLDPLYLALDQLRKARKNAEKAVARLAALETAEQRQRHLAAPSIELPRFSYRLDVDGQVELEDVLETQARELYVRFDLDKRNVRLYERPVSSTDPKGWETIEWNYDLDE